MSYRGDYDAGTVIYGKFTTFRPSTGAPFALAGTPALSVYKDNSTAQSTTGVTLTADFDTVTGLNHFAIDTSADGTFYSAGSNFDIVITTGTVDGVSVVGSVVASFSLRKDSALKPTTAARTLDVSAGGEAGIDWANIGSPTTAVNLSGTNIDTDQVVASVSGAVGSVAGNVGGNVTGSVGSVAADGITATSLAASAITEIQSGLASQASVDTIDGIVDAILVDTGTDIPATLSAIAGYVDTEVGAIKAVTDKLDTALELDGAVYRYTTNALEQAPTGGSAPTASQIADEVQTRTIAAVTTVNGLAANSVTAAALAADAGTEIGTAVWASATRTLTALDEDSTTLDLDSTIRAAVGLASANLDTQFGDLPTATENADALLNRDMSAVSDTNARSPLQALRFLRNKWSLSGTTLTVTKEDDATSAWTAVVTTSAGAEPITGSDPG